MIPERLLNKNEAIEIARKILEVKKNSKPAIEIINEV